MSYHDLTVEQVTDGDCRGPDPTENAITVAMRAAGDDPCLGEDDEEWVSQVPSGLRVRAVTGVLMLLLFAVC